MNQKARLAICTKCIRRKLDYEVGYICQLTGNPADFNGNCKHYVQDETVSEALGIRTEERPFVPLFEPVPESPESETKRHPVKQKAVNGKAVKAKASGPKGVHNNPDAKIAVERKTLSIDAHKKLRRYQSFIYAVLGGLLVTLVCSLGWAFTEALTGFSGAYMAIGAGFLVGLGIRYFGAGMHWVFGMLAALLALAGSLLGYYLSQTSFLEVAQLERVILLPDYLNPEFFLGTLRETFVPLDLAYYGLAALLAFFLAIRRISKKKRVSLEDDIYNGAPALYWLRLPLILAGILIPAYYGYTHTHGDAGENRVSVKTQNSNAYVALYYDSGEKMSEGAMNKDQETGEWTSWHENGNLKSKGQYEEGKMNGLWKWYDEAGVLTGTGSYEEGVESGTWMHYYADGVVSDSGSYTLGLKEGLWKFYHENGNLKYSINYKAGMMHGEKILLSASGTTVKVDYFENGIRVEKD
jgi:antitoxin component YwqK of YwqJK toxin-antitoxin module